MKGTILDLMHLGLFGWFVGSVAVITTIIAYVYISIVLYTIAKKLKKPYAWMAWIPLVNLIFYMPMLAGYEWYFGFLYILMFIPWVGVLVPIALMVWWWWRIAENRNFPGWLGILMIIPVVNIIIPAIIAWAENK